MKETYGKMYSTPAAAAAYDEVICQHEDDPAWAAEQHLLRKLIRQHVRVPAKARAVDFACGSGRVLRVLQPLVGELIGIDISGAMLERAAARSPGVRLIQADIVADPEAVPKDLDLVTAFRFLLLAEPPLREACLRILGGRVRRGTGVLIVNSHGNPWSFRMLANIRNMLMGRPQRLDALSFGTVRTLAASCGLRIVGASGCGFIPHSIRRVLPMQLCKSVETALAGCPLLWRCGTNLMFVLAPTAPDAPERSPGGNGGGLET